MIAADPLWIVYKAGWYFYALGPQLVACLFLGYLTAKRYAGSMLNWLVVAFFAAMLPLVGAAVMLVLWWRGGSAAGRRAAQSDVVARTDEPPA
jgi:hypothetical protein